MPKICYITKDFSGKTRKVIDQANVIIEEYVAQDFVLTLRQLYYQFVARGFLDNTQKQYKRLGEIVSDARLAGEIDWDHLTDRTRNLESLPHWSGPADILESCSKQFRIDKWADQEYRPEVWIEKEALAGVFERVCEELVVPYFSCRGYNSQSEMWAASQRLRRYLDGGQTPIIFQFGDHDPSGIDMTRDIKDRLETFLAGAEQKRLALNMDQVKTHSPPPNPAKTTDSRYASYIRIHGTESWELDALDPTILAGLVRDAIEGIRDDDAWEKAAKTENEHKRLLSSASKNWETITRSKVFREEDNGQPGKENR